MLSRTVALVGAFGLVAVAIGAMSMAAMSRSAASYATTVWPAVEPVRDPESDEAPSPASTEESRPPRQGSGQERAGRAGTAPGARVDPAWAARTAAATGIPPRALLAYAAATLTVNREQPGCGLAWNTIAGIGAVESAHATHGGAVLLESGLTSPKILGPTLDGVRTAAIRDTDRGAWDGDRTWDRAVGPMQFIPSTWRKWGADGNGDGRANPNQIDDAALATGRYLCASGPLTTPAGWRAAVYSYNHSDAYVDSVAGAANGYAAAAGR